MDPRIAHQLEALGVCQNEVNCIHSGADRWVVQYRDAFCLVVANREDVKCRLEAERCVLSRLHPCPNVRTPEPVWDRVPEGVFVYTFIPGRTFNKELVAAATDEEANINTERLSDFLTVLHNTPCQDMNFLPTRNYFHSITSVGREERVRDVLRTNDLLEPFDRVIRLWKATESSGSREIGLLHGDFAGHNLIVGDHDRCVTGVIDFVDCFIGDVHFDFRWFYRYGKSFWEQLVRKYVSKSGRRISDEALQMYFLLDAFCHLFYAITYDRPRSLEPGVQAVKELLEQ